MDILDGGPDLPEGFWYSVKRRLLGPPLVNEQLGEQRLSKPLALGVLSPDGISSSAYGTEEILIALLPLAGTAGTAPFAVPSGVSTSQGPGQPGAVASGTAGEETSPIRR